jgi:hypothetical protein
VLFLAGTGAGTGLHAGGGRREAERERQELPQRPQHLLTLLWGHLRDLLFQRVNSLHNQLHQAVLGLNSVDIRVRDAERGGGRRRVGGDGQRC